ncbi:MAG TPA: hypothetical protein VHW74_04365 [Mycobacteriales bacterium]|jgi:hypothetical protein|nr:hypothetical protein [Mycobacteriales bacterium]
MRLRHIATEKPGADEARGAIRIRSSTSSPWYHPTGWLRGDAYDRAAATSGMQILTPDSCDELALPAVIHTHFEGVGIAELVTAAGEG